MLRRKEIKIENWLSRTNAERRNVGLYINLPVSILYLCRHFLIIPGRAGQGRLCVNAYRRNKRPRGPLSWQAAVEFMKFCLSSDSGCQ
ncbi:hypothetical protein Micbo1qcDRAFT_3758 [Microdochium bolleyi]|uniref:Uncharacterized protein n=1 Tax=Microdochium bolleyi TaxID=196109 RepID=A0A136JI94_9PEZI|nr:hypothetical protein Micbo1qcDRAFT_3758 [Microdochium bolleyi]